MTPREPRGPDAPRLEARRVTSGAPWEDKVGYRRAVRVGDRVWVSGTVAVTPEGGPFAPGDPGLQAARCIEIIADALKAAGGDLSCVVRTRIYLTDMRPEAQAAVGAAHLAAFRDHPPASSMIGVAALADPDFLVEIEADAVLA